MLPPLNQLADARMAAESTVAAVGPSRDALQRPSAPPSAASATPTPYRPAGANAPHRRVSATKPLPSASPAFSSPRRATYRPSVLSARVSLPTSSVECDVQRGAGSAVTTAVTAIETISRVPREFFVVETNAVLPVTQFPPAQYQSTFLIGSGAWETVVFPALTPRTRQQVLCLRQTLETMRLRAAAAAHTKTSVSTSETTVTATAMLTVEYTEKEWALHALCFHELARQIKFICREQSELLFEIEEAYDASVARLAALVRQLHAQLNAQQLQINTLNEQLRAAQEDAERRITNQRDAPGFSPNATPACACGHGRNSRHSRQRSPHRSGGYNDDGDDDNDEDEDEWRAFQQQQRRLRMREFAARDDDDDDDSEDGGRGRGRLQRASIVEENSAAARVQQAFAKYQQRKEAARLLLRQEKKDAALGIQRSYRGYRERKRALHHRAVTHTILKRRKQVAAVELLQMNVRAYLIKKRREYKHGIVTEDTTGEPTTAHASMMEAQRAAALVAAMASTTVADERPRNVASPSPTLTATTTPEQDASAGDRFAQLLNSMSELAAAFSFLHSRRRNAKKAATMTMTPSSGPSSEETVPLAVVVGVERGEHFARGAAGCLDGDAALLEASTTTAPTAPHEAHGEQEEASADDVKIDDAERALLDATIRRAEDLVLSFKSVISDLRPGDDSLTKATSTTTLVLDSGDDGQLDTNCPAGTDHNASSLLDALGSAALVFLEDDNAGADKNKSWQGHGRASPVAPERDASPSSSPFDDNDDDNSDATHLDDVLWQAAVYTQASSGDKADEASARQLLLRELLASRDQQKRFASLKQFIADIYDTVVGRLRELPRARLDKLMQVHASLALSFQAGKRLLRVPRRQHTSSSASPNEYEPVSAFVGRLELQALIHDHFHCQVGLKHLVDAASENVVADLRHFMGLDADVQRFHEYLVHDRSLEDLVFFCLCRLCVQASGTTRQPVFHRANLRELVDARCAMAVASRFFYASGSDDASMVATDAFVIEPSNEIYARHLPSSGLAQLDAILRDIASPVDTHGGGDHDDGHLQLEDHLRATNASHFHAPEYNASAPRSPLRRPLPPHETSSTWLFFPELVDLLRRYRSVMRHFHAFVQWTYELFHEAFREQRRQELDGGAHTGTPLLEEAAFVATLLPFSRGASDRELRNVFHNALKQRQLQRLMPVRVFVSVVLVLLRNGLLSVASYKPLVVPPAVALAHKKPSALARADAPSSYLGSQRRQREEKQWVQLALQWRAQEQRFEATIERLYANNDGGGSEDEETESVAAASRLLQWRNELYELFMLRCGREHLQRAQQLYELLVTDLAHDDRDAGEAIGITTVPETDDDGDGGTGEGDGSPRRFSRDRRTDDGAAAAVGSPWATDPTSSGGNQI